MVLTNRESGCHVGRCVMSPAELSSTRFPELPESLRPLFWDSDFDHLDGHEHRDFIIRRVLAEGAWETVCWLRTELGNAPLRDWILRHQGRSLTPQQLRFWELILDLPSEAVDSWLQSEERKIWELRVAVGWVAADHGRQGEHGQSRSQHPSGWNGWTRSGGPPGGGHHREPAASGSSRGSASLRGRTSPATAASRCRLGQDGYPVWKGRLTMPGPNNARSHASQCGHCSSFCGCFRG